jgi:hypothetical protein
LIRITAPETGDLKIHNQKIPDFWGRSLPFIQIAVSETGDLSTFSP